MCTSVLYPKRSFHVGELVRIYRVLRETGLTNVLTHYRNVSRLAEQSVLNYCVAQEHFYDNAVG
jgi:hypothetical protein